MSYDPAVKDVQTSTENFVAAKLGAAGAAENMSCKFFIPRSLFEKGEGVAPMGGIGQWIGGSRQKNSFPFFLSFCIEEGVVSGKAWWTHPSRLAGSGPGLSLAIYICIYIYIYIYIYI